MVSPRYNLALRMMGAAALAVLLVCLHIPTTHGQGGSPVQPEYTGQPVPAGPSVNEFTGDFSYGLPVLTVPGPHGSSYSLTLSYQAGTNPNEDASWVGYGWSLNPGAIIRNKRGFPDDWDGQVIYHNKVPLDYTVTTTDVANIEFGSFDFLDPINPGLGGSVAIRYNSYTGFGKTWLVSPEISGFGQSAGLTYSNDNGDGELEPVLSINLWALGAHWLASQGEEEKNESNTPASEDDNSNTFLKDSKKLALKRLLDLGSIPNVFRSRELDIAPPSVVPITGTSKKMGNGFSVTGLPGVVSGIDVSSVNTTMEARPQERTTLNAYGFLQSVSGGQDTGGVMDYYYEKDVPYKLDDKYLPIPFSNADLFTVTGGGTFRAFNRGLSYFRQNRVTSETDIDNEQITGIGGASFGVGYRWGDGSIVYDARAWDNPEAPAYHTFTNEGDEPWFFRFSNDLGGNLLYDDNDNAISADIENHSGVIGDVLNFLRINDIDQFPRLPNNVGLQLKDWERPGRSDYVGYTLNKDILLQKNDKYYRSYARDQKTLGYVVDRDSIGNQIGEFALFGSGGSRRVYGLPVFAKNEKSVSLGLQNITLDSAANVYHNFLAYSYVDESKTSTVIGEEIAGRYAVAWLLTEITTPDYIDLTGNGPTDDDLGGWTKFHYTRVEGGGAGTSNWRYWRQPYRGLYFDAGDLSDPEDDLGGYSQGYAERYYLSRIETKTHVAVFNLNKGTEQRRNDAQATRPSWIKPEVIAGDSTFSHAWPYVAQFARYLDNIELYTKNVSGAPDSLLFRVYFEYDYSLRPNMPNSLVDSGADRHGVLTLRKVWWESLNVRNNRIAPYLFGYDYRTSEDYSATVRARYPEITSFADSLSDEQQNPSYNPYDFDPWGFYRPDGAARFDRRSPFIPQNDTSVWDPAAWQLKWIKFPGGGELHVQYEQDDYSFVHDRPAMAMVSLKERATSEFADVSIDADNNNKYYLNLSDIGVDSTSYDQVARVRELLEQQKRRSGKLLFRFLYALRGDTARIGNPEYNSGYLEGYADLDAVAIQTMQGGTPNEWYALYVRLIGRDENGNPDDKGLPKTICWDYVRKRKRGKLGLEPGVSYSTDRRKMVNELKRLYYSFHPADHCKTLDYANSYIRIPMITPKKGGGLRVKRLLSYDPSIEGDSALYGTEYHYEVYDQERNEVISSGVASNEPDAIRSENALVDFLQRDSTAKLKGKVVFASERARNEGPLGESLLPVASVGYARVASHPIHQGITAKGFNVTDFHTYRDYPFDARYGDPDPAVHNTPLNVYDYRTLPIFENLLIYQQSEHLVSATQGYRFVLSDLHGAVRRRLTNGGAYTPLESDWMNGSMTEYQYFQPGDSVPLLYHVGDSIRYGYPGKEMEIVHASRKNGSYISNLQIEGDAGFWFLSGRAYFAVDNSELSTHVTSKVVNYPSIIKSVSNYADGVYSYEENIGFDPRTGDVVLTRSRDAYDGLKLEQSTGGHTGTYVGYAVPAADVHPEFDQVAVNEHARIISTENHQIIKGKDGSGRRFLDFPGGSETRWLRKLTPGDLIELTTPDDEDAGRYHVDEIVGNVVWLLESGLYNEGSTDPSLSIVDEAVNIEIIHSGRENIPEAGIGGFVTYGETDAEVAVGANIGWSGPGAAARLAFVDLLNDSLSTGAGFFDENNVDTTLEFRLISTGTCGTLGALGETFAMSVTGDMVRIAMPDFTTDVYIDTLLGVDSGGWFDLDASGQVVFRVKGRPDISQRVRAFRFCGENVYRSAANVLRASMASRFNDTVDWDGSGLAVAVGDPNAYEKGERGRWSARTRYAYNTELTQGSEPVTGERNYKNAGVFNDFSLFNWREPASSDMSRWFRLDTITGITRHNVTYKSLDLLGHSSLVLFDYGKDSTLVPIVNAWNADEGTVAFESFERYHDSAFTNHVLDNTAHSGKLALRVNSDQFNFPLTATQQVLDNGLLVRFWMYPLWKDNAEIRLSTGGTPATFSVTGSNRIARAGEWALYECHLTGSSLDALYSPGDPFTLWFERASGGDTLWMDDIKIQPADAVVTGYAYDKKTFAPIAAFSDRNFGMYPQYDAEGKALRTLIETAEGVKTLSESHLHIPGAVRDWLGDGAPFSPLSAASHVGNGSPTSISNGGADPQQSPRQGTNFDLLNVEVGLTDRKVSLFGMEPSKLRERVQEKIGAFNALSPQELALLDRYEQLNHRYRELKKSAEEARTEDARNGIEAELKEIESERDSLLRQLGIDRVE